MTTFRRPRANDSPRWIRRAFKTELDPNNKQKAALRQHAGAARWAYNFCLRRKIESYEATGNSLSSADIHKEIIILKGKSREKGGEPWLRDVSKWAPQEATHDVDFAYEQHFRRCKTLVKNKGFPKFKSRKYGVGSFTLIGNIHVTESSIRVPKIGILRLKEKWYLPLDCIKNVKFVKVTISEKAGRWFVSLQIKTTITDERAPARIIGVDTGIKNLASQATAKYSLTLRHEDG